MTFLDALTRACVRYRRTGDTEIVICCPFCIANRGEPDTEFRFNVNIKTGAGHCWHSGCGFKSRNAVFAILKELHVNGAFQLEGEQSAQAAPQEPVTLPRDFQPLTRVVDDLDRTALNYLLRRGVTREQIAEHRIGVSYGGRYGYRIVFPVVEGRVLRGIVARDFTGTQTPKYLNSPGDKWFWGFQPEAETVVLAEGIIKALKIRTATGQSASALLGHTLTVSQRQQLDRSQCKHVVLWPDPDRVGRQGVCKIADDLVSSWPGVVSVVWPVAKPADDMTMSEIQEAWKTVAPYTWTVCQRMSLSAG
jgi:hypothetical protein